MIALLTDEGAASAFLERHRWPDGPACPHCGVPGRMGRLADAPGRRSQLKCYACRKFSTIRTGTMLEGSHLSSCAILASIWLLIGSQGVIRPQTLALFIGTTTSTALKLCFKLVPVIARVELPASAGHRQRTRSRDAAQGLSGGGRGGNASLRGLDPHCTREAPACFGDVAAVARTGGQDRGRC